jgi:hypothetical protein
VVELQVLLRLPEQLLQLVQRVLQRVLPMLILRHHYHSQLGLLQRYQQNQQQLLARLIVLIGCGGSNNYLLS